MVRLGRFFEDLDRLDQEPPALGKLIGGEAVRLESPLEPGHLLNPGLFTKTEFELCQCSPLPWVVAS